MYYPRFKFKLFVATILPSFSTCMLITFDWVAGWVFHHVPAHNGIAHHSEARESGDPRHKVSGMVLWSGTKKYCEQGWWQKMGWFLWWLTRGHYSNNSSASLHDYESGAIAWFSHRTKKGPGHNWEGTSGSTKGDMFNEILGKVKAAGFVFEGSPRVFSVGIFPKVLCKK